MDEKRHSAEDHICEGCWNDASEPDVLERGKVYFDEHFTEEGPIPRELCSDVERLLADAIAEIKRLESELGIEQEFKAQAIEARNEAQAQLRAITEAEPVKWESRNIKKGHPWAESNETLNAVREKLPEYETRALAVVAPKGDTEE